MKMKRCTGACGQEKPETDFYVKDKRTGRRFSWCKDCHSKRCRADYHGPKHEERKAQRREYGRAHKDGRAAYMATWRAKNPEASRTAYKRQDARRSGTEGRKAVKRRSAATYRRKHADAIAAYNAAYRERNREILRLRYRQWCQDNPERAADIRRRWKAANRATVNAATHRRRALLRGCSGTWTPEEWDALKEAQDFTCLCCGLREPEITLTPDHVVSLAAGGSNSILNLQGLCGSCNPSKGAKCDDFRDEALSAWLDTLLAHGIEPGDVVPPDAGIGDGSDDPDDIGPAEPAAAATGLPADELPLAAGRKQWAHLDDAGLDRYAARLAAHHRQAGYPHYRLTDAEKARQLELLVACRERAVVSPTPAGGVIHTGGQGLALCWSHFPHAPAVRCGGRRTAMETYECDRWLLAAIRRRLSRGDYVSDSGIRKAIRTAPGVQAVSNFRPTAAMAVYGRFRRPGGLDVWDMSAGFGGRLLGAWASGAVRRYVGTDPCVPTFDGLCRMRDELPALGVLPAMAVELHRQGSEDFRPEAGSLDLCFTSPPYFATEDYGTEDAQSHRRFPAYDAWLDGFLRATLDNCRHGLRPGGVLALNVASTRQAPRLEADAVRVAEAAGFRLVETVRLGLAHLAAGGYKHEPLFVFARD